MGRFAALFVFLLLASLTFALFTEHITVQVLDQKGRPIQNASVTASYQYRSKVPDNVSRITGANGMANLTINNVEYNEKLVDYTYTLYARYGDSKNYQEASSIYTVGKHPDVITMTLRVFQVVVGAFDQNKMPLSALAHVGDFQKQTDGSGYAVFAVPFGATEVGIDYGETKKAESVSINDDITRTFEIDLYPLNVLVVDDRANPIEGAKVIVGLQQNLTNAAGEARFKNVEDPKMKIVTEYQGKTKTTEMSLTQTSDYRIVFDTTPPDIRDVNVTSANGIGLIRIVAEDMGTYPSGLGQGSKIYIKYSVDGGVPAQATMYPSGKNTYRAEIPAQKAGSIVRYTIYAQDADGNVNSATGVYEVIGEATGNSTGTTPSNSGGNGGGFSIDLGKGPLGIDWLYIVVGAIIVIIAAGVYFKMKENQ